MTLELISHHLCPYVQRAAIVLLEKEVVFDRVDIDLSDKPAWFMAISPLGKTPLLRIGGGEVVFESAVICEYLEETEGGRRLHPADPLLRARHRGWIEFASATLNTIAGLYNAPDLAGFEGHRNDLVAKFRHVEGALGVGPYFGGAEFTLVDAAFAPVFRYFETFDTILDLGVFRDRPKIMAWRGALAARSSVIAAMDPGYPARLMKFLRNRPSYLSRVIKDFPK